MDFFVTRMYVSHTLCTLQQIAMNNMKIDLILKKYDGFLIMYGWNTPWGHSFRKWNNENRETKKMCV